LGGFFKNLGIDGWRNARPPVPSYERKRIMAKAKIKTVDRALAKSGIYSADFANGGKVQAHAADFFPGSWDGFNEVQKGLIFNGLTQKLNDSHAGAKSGEEAYKDTAAVLAVLKPAEGEGKWSTRIPGEGGVTGGSFAVAYAEFKGITVEAAREMIAAAVEDNMDENTTEKAVYAQVRASVLKKYPEVQDIINRLKAEQNAKKETIETNL
jgi:hypothetical protein